MFVLCIYIFVICICMYRKNSGRILNKLVIFGEEDWIGNGGREIHLLLF